MDIRELSIDNYMLFRASEKMPLVSQMTCGHFFKLSETPNGIDGMKYFDIKPIELDEEWLIKLGFTRIDPFTWSILAVVLDAEIDVFSIVDEDGLLNAYSHSGFLREVHHIHQLQNLYSSLTGEYLTLKEPIDRDKYKSE